MRNLIDQEADSVDYLSSLARHYINLKQSAKNHQKKDALDIISSVLTLNIEDQPLKEMLSSESTYGNPLSYIMNKFTKENYVTIENELSKTKSIRLKAHYADFLWLTKKTSKPHEKAKIAIDSYLELVKLYEEKDSNDIESKKFYGSQISNYLQRAFSISQQIKYKTLETKAELERLVVHFNANSHCKNSVTFDLIKTIIDHKKQFQESLFKQLIKICKDRANFCLKHNSFDFAREFLSLGNKIEINILKNPTKEWQEKLANSYIAQAKCLNNLLSLKLLKNAMEIFQQIEQEQSLKEASKLYSKMSKTVKLHTKEHKANIGPLIHTSEQEANRLIKLPPEEILIYLTTTNLYPNYLQLKKKSLKDSQDFISRELLSPIILDQNMNLEENSDTASSKLKTDYNQDLKYYSIYLDVVFKQLISTGKLDWRHIKKFLQKYSWLGRDLTITNSTGKSLTTPKWINLLEPGIKHYIKAAKDTYNSKNTNSAMHSILLATESLSLKPEGIIRDIFKLLKIPTNKLKKPKAGITGLEESDLNTFLTSQEAKDIFEEDFLNLMKAVLIERSSYNLRNNIAHSFFIKEHFRLNYLHWLLMIILQLGNYPKNGKKV